MSIAINKKFIMRPTVFKLVKFDNGSPLDLRLPVPLGDLSRSLQFASPFATRIVQKEEMSPEIQSKLHGTDYIPSIPIA